MWNRFKQDALRWVVPGQIADPSVLTWTLLLHLLLRHPALRAMAWFRLACWCKAKRIPLVAGPIHRWLFFRFGLELGGDIEGGLYIAHPVGTVINARQIGRNCSVIAAVTVGMRNEWVFPVIGDGVFIGAGARVLGDLWVGDNAKIGANAVVLNDIPANATAVGVPARVIKIEGNDVKVNGIEGNDVKVNGHHPRAYPFDGPNFAGPSHGQVDHSLSSLHA